MEIKIKGFRYRSETKQGDIVCSNSGIGLDEKDIIVSCPIIPIIGYGKLIALRFDDETVLVNPEELIKASVALKE